MLPGNVNAWIGPVALAALILAALLFLALVIQHTIGIAIVHHVERRQRVLVPLILRSIGNADAVPALRQNLQPFDLRIVRDVLMQFAMDLRAQDCANIACLCDQLGLLEPEIRSLFALRPRTRRRAAANLGLLRPAAAVEPLLELLDDRYINVRLAAIDALGDIGDDLGLVALIPLLEDPEPAIAWRALEALCRSGHDVGIEVLRYLELTRDSNASRAAVESMRWLEPRRAEDRLCEIARGIRSRLRAQTARVLAAIGSSRCESELHSLLSDHNSEVRAQAAKALGTLGRSGSLPALRAAFVDPSWPVRMEAARALLEMKEPGITAFLEELSSAGREGGASDPPVANRTAVRAQVA
ncbi:MAG TPA: HEAT repeat domain-containing protein [Planctomycetota bacterium]|nr:HEAT repeat domain-containing protein [Planctomycetota bacterium]